MIIKHLGLIPDGNRRWARFHVETIDEAYRLFCNNVLNIIASINDLKITELSLYLASKENLERTRDDIVPVIKAIKRLMRELPDIAIKNDTKITCLGLENVKDAELVELADDVTKKTKNNRSTKVNLLIGYNPFDEIQTALKCCGSVSIDTLSVKSYVDLVIRTAGDIRLSNFLPLQCGYANIEVLDKSFNDLSIEDIVTVIDKYKHVTPNYGK